MDGCGHRPSRLGRLCYDDKGASRCCGGAVMSFDGNSLSLESFRDIVDKSTKIAIDERTRTRLVKSRAVVEKAIQSGERVYSINTGFGILSKVTIEASQLEE